MALDYFSLKSFSPKAMEYICFIQYMSALSKSLFFFAGDNHNTVCSQKQLIFQSCMLSGGITVCSWTNCWSYEVHARTLKLKMVLYQLLPAVWNPDIDYIQHSAFDFPEQSQLISMLYCMWQHVKCVSYKDLVWIWPRKSFWTIQTHQWLKGTIGFSLSQNHPHWWTQKRLFNWSPRIWIPVWMSSRMTACRLLEIGRASCRERV